MKFLKLLFGKTFVVILAFLIQLLIFFGLVLFLNQYFVVFQIISLILGLIAFLQLVNKKQTPEFKIPWMFLMLVIPLFGVVLYILFANPRMSKKLAEKIRSRQADSKKFIGSTDEEKALVKSSLGDLSTMENYLRTTARSSGRLNNSASYFSSGESFYQDLLSELKKAEKFIFMEYFIIDYGKMWNGIHDVLLEKVKAGVKVKLIYDDIGALGKLRNGYYRTLRRQGIECHKFNPFRPVVSAVFNNRDHRKITVIDGKVGYTGGINLADEYINEISPYGHWCDTAVKLRGSAVKELTAMFLQMFDVTSGQVSDLKEYLDVESEVFEESGVVQVFGDGPNPVDKELIGENNIINIISNAKKYVYITTPYLVPDFNIITALRNSAMSGVDVRIVTPSIPDKKFVFDMTRSNYKYLMDAGVKIYEYTPGFIHAKQIISDDEVAFVGTINLDYRSLVHHFECGVMLYKTPCIKDVKQSFEDIFEKSLQVDGKNCKVGVFKKLFVLLLNLFSPML